MGAYSGKISICACSLTNSFIVFEATTSSNFLSEYFSRNVWSIKSMSPMIALMRELFPEPTSPITHTNSPCLISTFISLSVISDSTVPSDRSSGFYISGSFFSSEMLSYWLITDCTEFLSEFLPSRPQKKFPLVILIAVVRLGCLSSLFTTVVFISSQSMKS